LCLELFFAHRSLFTEEFNQQRTGFIGENTTLDLRLMIETSIA